MPKNDNKNNNDNKKPTPLPKGLSSIADDEAITEIDFNNFLEESSKTSELFEGFHEDIENTEKSLESELQSLYDDILNSGPDTIVPKPLSMLTESEAEPKNVVLSSPEESETEGGTLDDLWMNPEDYYDEGVAEEAPEEAAQEVPEEATEDFSTFEELPDDFSDAEELPEDAPADEEMPEEISDFAEESIPGNDDPKSAIFDMIDSLKSEADYDAGFSDILSEIESNQNILPVDPSLSSASRLVTTKAEPLPVIQEDYEELVFNNDDFETPEADAAAEPPVEETGVEESPVEGDDPAEESAQDSADSDVIDTSSEDFDRELAALLGDEPPVESAEDKKPGFVVDIPENEDFELPAGSEAAVPALQDRLYRSEPMSGGASLLDEGGELIDEDEESSKKKKKGKDSGDKEKKPASAGEIIRRIVLSISIITIIVSCGILANTYLIEPYRFRSSSDDLAEQMSVNVNEHSDSAIIADNVKQENPEVNFPEGMLAKYAQLYAANDDLAGWVSIPGFEINLPIAKTSDNKYYLKRDIYGRKTSYGVPFFDYRMSDLVNLHKNTVVYGHNMRHDDLIFGLLENYREIGAGFAKAPVIECNTIFGDHSWFVYAVFITNSDPGDDNGYVFPYNFIDVSDAKFADYIKEIDKRKLYTTGVDINETDNILTLSTCSYDFEDARLVVVAREKRAGESISVDTSKAFANPNPKYPQAWYDANKKTNPYSEDPRW